jgi:hypothetical protein
MQLVGFPPVDSRLVVAGRTGGLVVAARLHVPEQGLAESNRRAQVGDVIGEVAAQHRLAGRVLGDDGIRHRLERGQQLHRRRCGDVQHLAESPWRRAAVGLDLRLQNRQAAQGDGQQRERDTGERRSFRRTERGGHDLASLSSAVG